MSQADYIRLSKLMSERGLCSRREADVYIEKGQVLVNGEIISVLGTKVAPDAQIQLNQTDSKQQSRKTTVLLNKPLGYVSTQPEDGYTAAVELIRPENYVGEGRVYPDQIRNLNAAGRLDIDSKGLLILSQDGTVVKTIIGPESNLEKEYLVGVEGVITPQIIQKLSFGLSLDDKPLKRASVQQVESDLLRFVLKEGKKRQIRRMCELVNLRVVKLKRIRVGRVRLGELPEGKWRFLAPHESFV